MPCPFANEFNVHAIHQEVTDVGMPQPVKRDRCHLGRSDKPAKRFAERVGVHRLAIGTSKHEPARIAPKSELQPLFELHFIVLSQGFDRDSRQGNRSPAGFCFR